MAARDTGSEQHIKDVAKRLFFSEGKLHATMQDIADAAGVNRTLLNYYFRSRDALFKQVYEEAQYALAHRMDEALRNDLPFRRKVEHIIDVFLEELHKYPYREIFMITEINTHDVSKKFEASRAIRDFMEETQRQMDAGNILPMDPHHFFLNLLSMLTYPTVVRPLMVSILTTSERQYKALIAERKEIVLKVLFAK